VHRSGTRQSAPFATVPDLLIQDLQRFDSCTISNAIEQLKVRTRNEGFVDGSVRCTFPDLAPRCGYAVTASIRSSSTPIAGRCYFDRTDWWTYVRTVPAPRFLVLQDVDDLPGLGALFGEIHACIAASIGCTAILTNGSVRDLPGVRQTGLQMFSSRLAVSHAYAHVVDFGIPVEIGGLRIQPGDLLHGDQHGVVCIPTHVAPSLPKLAAELLASEKELIDYCRSGDFSFPGLLERIQSVSAKTSVPDQDLT
jgi:4-hydroxy-4-methyl-2-oxoglutarate aldolase